MLKSMDVKHMSIMFGNVNAQDVQFSYVEGNLQISVNVE